MTTISNNSYTPSAPDTNAPKKSAQTPSFGLAKTGEDTAAFSTTTPAPASQQGLFKWLLAGGAATAVVIAVTHKNAAGENLISRLTGKAGEKGAQATPPLPHDPESAHHLPDDLNMPPLDGDMYPQGSGMPPTQPKPPGFIMRSFHRVKHPWTNYDDAMQRTRMKYERAEHQHIGVQIDLDRLQKAVDKAEERLAKAKASYAEKGRAKAVGDIKTAIDKLETAKNDLRVFQKTNAKQIAEIKKQRKAAGVQV